MKKLLLSVLLFCGLTSAGLAQITFTSVSPAMHALDVPANSNITLTFSTDLDANYAIQPNDTYVHGSIKGRYHVALSYNQGSRTLTINPDDDFFAGELITVTVLTKFNIGYGQHTTTRQFFFTVAATGTGVGAFESATITGNLSGSYAKKLKAVDLGNDGDIDFGVIYSDERFEMLHKVGENFASVASGQYSGFNLTDLIFADFNHDYDMDLAIMNNAEANSIIVHYNKDGFVSPTESFNTPSYFTATGWTLSNNKSLYSADVDRDGFPELFISNSGKYGINKFANVGDSSFTFNTIGLSSSAQTQLITGDFNNDGFLDYAGINSDTVSVLLSSSSSGFAARNVYIMPSTVGRIEVGDFNGDGHLDILAGSSSKEKAYLLKNDQDGTFTLADDIILAGAPGDKLRTGDMDGDGDLDIVYANQSRFYIAFNDGTGVFSIETSTVAGFITDLVIVDADLDGDLDIALIRNGYNQLFIYTNTNSVDTPNSQSIVNSFSSNYGTSVNVEITTSYNTMLIARAGSAVNFTPTDGQAYIPNSEFGSGSDLGDGNYVVSNGALAQNTSSKTVNITGLTPGTTYHFAVYTRAGANSATKYNSTPGTGSVTSRSEEGYDFLTVAGKAAIFAGSDHSANINLAELSSPFTVEAWVKPTLVGVAQTVLMYGEDELVVGIGADNKFYAVHTNGASSSITLNGTTTVSKDNWYHIAISAADGGNFVLNINGEDEDSESITTATINGANSNPFFYVATNWDEDSFFTGYVDELRLWSEVRSVTNIRTYMRNPPTGFAPNLTYYWQFGNQTYEKLDKISAKNFDISSSYIVNSDLPFGANATTYASSFTSGEITVGNATLNTSDAFDNPVDIQVSEYENAPANMPSGYSFAIGNRYFLIDIFGDAGTFNTSLTLNLGSGKVSSEEASDPSLLKLYKRSSSSLGAFALAASASSANSSTGVVVFNGITSFSQFVVTSGDPFYLAGQTDTTVVVNKDSTYYTFTKAFFKFAEGYEDSTLTVTINDDNLDGYIYMDGDNELYGDDENEFTPSTNYLSFEPYEQGLDEVTFKFSTTKGNSTLKVKFAIINLNPSFKGNADASEWQLISNPFQMSLGSFLSPIWTQGAPNSNAPTGSANLFTFNEETAQWAAITSDLNTTTLTAGKGVIAYMFNDDNPNDGIDPVDGGWPKTFYKTGAIHGAEATLTLKNVDVDASETLNGNEGWVLIGNPFGYGISAGNIKSAIDDELTTYDNEHNEVSGVSDYVYGWNPETNAWVEAEYGNLDPYQSMFVRLLIPDSEMELVIDKDDIDDSDNILLNGGGGGEESSKNPEAKVKKSAGADKKASTPKFIFTLHQTENKIESKFGLSFTENGKVGIDSKDAFYLWPLSNQYANMYMKVGDQSVKINNLPSVTKESLSIPVYLDATVGGEFNLTWNPELIPEGFIASLIEVATGESYSLNEDNHISFTVKNIAKRKALDGKDIMHSGISLAATSSSDPTFMLKVNPITTANESEIALPKQVELSQNFPNPFNPSSTIQFAVPQKAQVKLEVYDILGRRISTLVNEVKPAGRYTVTFNAHSMASGVYFYRLIAGDKIMTKQMTLIK